MGRRKQVRNVSVVNTVNVVDSMIIGTARNVHNLSWGRIAELFPSYSIAQLQAIAEQYNEAIIQAAQFDYGEDSIG